MRASVNDFTKVMPVVREQILSALNRQPETLEACKKELDQLARTIEIGYNCVLSMTMRRGGGGWMGGLCADGEFIYIIYWAPMAEVGS